MESQVSHYTTAIKTVLREYQQLQTPHAAIELLFDDEHMRYLAMRVGWYGQKRIHLCLAHIDIVGEVVIIQSNNTEAPLATELVENGIPKEKIGLGFIPPEAQQYAEYPAQCGVSDLLHHEESLHHAVNA